MPITKSIWMDLREGVEQLRNAVNNSERTERLEVTLPPSVNLATIFGLLLGFPVVYWSQPSQVPSSSLLETIVKSES
jgi:ABC-type sulfate transport system permease component